VILIALGVLALLLLALMALAYRISGLLLYPPRQPVTRTPAEYGLAYEDIAFQSRDGLALKGWWIPSNRTPGLTEPSPTVLLLHPMFGNRQGCSGHGHGLPRLLGADVDLLGVA
jgi:uncharacterized protein